MACVQFRENAISSWRQQICDGRLPMSSWEPWVAYFRKPSSVPRISSSSCNSQSSTVSEIAIGRESGTCSPAELIIERIFVFPSTRSTLKIPAKSFFRCDWMTAGFLAWPRISSRSSSPMK
jgi:hypothetical protein